MSKAYALSGLRAGYLVAHPATIDALEPWMPPWPLGLPAQVAAVEALLDPEYYQARWAETRALRAVAQQQFAALPGVRVYPSTANFFLIELDAAASVAAALRERGIFLREFASGPLAGRFLRVAVKDPQQNERIADELRLQIR
jgi:histidinol-phosphate/aromatic aminotransferase/cobyric acid decarboxylase-like protein